MTRRTLALATTRAVIAVDGGVAIVDTATGRATRIELADVLDLAIAGSELWIAAGAAPALHRFTLAGQRIGDALSLPDGGEQLRAAALGAPAALWTSTPPVIATGQGTTIVPGDWDCVLPVSATRWVACQHDRVALRDPASERWQASYGISSGRIVDGAVLFDGRAAALVVAHAGVLAQLIVIGLHDGAVHHRVTLTGIADVRFAPARGFALFRSAPRAITLFDLRFGRVLAEHVAPRDVREATLDTGGQRFLLRHGATLDDIAHGDVRELLAAPPEARVDAVDPAPPLRAPLPPAAPARDFHRTTVALAGGAALTTRDAIAPIATDAARGLLARYGELVAAIVGRAIAVGWDTGRIAFPNETALPYRGEVAGILGLAGGRAADELAAAERRVLDATAAVREAEAAAGPGAPLAILAAELGLTPVARLVLLLVAGPALWGELARLYGILGNDEDRPIADELVLVQILAGQIDRHAIANELDPTAPLVRHGLVRVDDRMRPFTGLTVDPVALAILRGERDIAVPDTRVVAAACSFDDLLIPAATKDAIARAIATAAPPARFVVRGRPGSGRHALLAALAATARRDLAVIDAAPLLPDRAQLPRLRDALCRAQLLGRLPCIDGLELLAADDRIGRTAIAAILDAHPGPLTVRLPIDARPPIAPGHVAIDLPALTLAQRTTAWHLILAAHRLNVRDPDELADRYGIGPATIVRVCERVAATPPATVETDRALELDVAIRQHLETGLRATATRVERLATWSRVVLPPDIQDSVLELIARIKHRRTVYDVWGYDQVLTTSRGVTALFQGAPGTGKTLVASAIANELGMDLYRVDLSRILSKWIGETEQNLAKLFDAAEDGHAIILFDEADSLFAKRTEVRTSVDRYANLEVNYLLQRFDTFEGIAILTTNFGATIDNAFKRRLSFRLTFPFPDEEAREALWRAHMAPSIPKSGDFDFGELARKYRLSGGYIRNAAVRAAFLAAEEQSPLTQHHLVRAIQAEFREIGKIAESSVLE